MKVDKIFSSLFFACIAVSCIAYALNSQMIKSNTICKDSSSNIDYKKGDVCYYYNNDKCFSGTCNNDGCKNCTKSLSILDIFLLFIGTFFILAFSYSLLDGLISK